VRPKRTIRKFSKQRHNISYPAFRF
jgi:hypothetical protein